MPASVSTLLYYINKHGFTACGGVQQATAVHCMFVYTQTEMSYWLPSLQASSVANDPGMLNDLLKW